MRTNLAVEDGMVNAARTQRKEIWVLEDDPGAQFVYTEILGTNYHLRQFKDIPELQEQMDTGATPPNLLIADLKLPGQTFTQFLHSAGATRLKGIQFIIISSVDDRDALNACFDGGAIDYITKPFGKDELRVKVERLLDGRNPATKVPGELEIDGAKLVIDPGSLKVWVGEKSSPILTAKEFQILTLLQRAPQATIRREDIVEQVWGNVRVGSKTLDVHLFNLRKKLQTLELEIQFLPPGKYQLKHTNRT